MRAKLQPHVLYCGRALLLSAGLRASVDDVDGDAAARVWALCRSAWTAVQDARVKGHSGLTAALSDAVLLPALFDVHDAADPRRAAAVPNCLEAS